MLYHFLFPIASVILSQVRTTGKVRPTYSQHARVKASQNSIKLPQILDYSSCVPFEIECNRDGKVIKVGYRTRYKGRQNGDIKPDIKLDKKVAKELDLILVVNTRNNFVRTIWLNRRSDQHKSLRLSRYANAHQIAS
jgi:hypothetical protein